MILRVFVDVNLRKTSVRPFGQLWRHLAYEGLLLVVLFKARSGRLWTDAETLDESFDFPDGKHLFIASLLFLNYLRLLQFPPLCRDNLQGGIFLEGINHWLLVFFLPMFILFIFLPLFMLKMYLQNDETGVLEILESKIFFAAQPWWEDFYSILY